MVMRDRRHQVQAVLSPLFTEVRGRGILRRSDAGYCIESRSRVMGWLLAALAAQDGVLYMLWRRIMIR
jgi:hypothetical protein